MLSIERINEMAHDGEYAAPDEFEVGKAELLRQHREEHFGPEDPRSDDELWAAYKKTIGEEA